MGFGRINVRVWDNDGIDGGNKFVIKFLIAKQEENIFANETNQMINDHTFRISDIGLIGFNRIVECKNIR